MICKNCKSEWKTDQRISSCPFCGQSLADENDGKHKPLGNAKDIQFGGYNWHVLDVQENRALLLAKDIIEPHPYNTDKIDITWETCTLRRYLNGDFINRFSEQEQMRILRTRNTNTSNLWFGTNGGNSTTDRVFLLSIEEVVKYFGDSGQLRNKNPNDDYLIDDPFNRERVAYYGNGTAWWWLRSPGYSGVYAAVIRQEGYLLLGGHDVNVNGGVRPALWLAFTPSPAPHPQQSNRNTTSPAPMQDNADERDLVEFSDEDGDTLLLEVMDYFLYEEEEFAVLCDAGLNSDCDDETSLFIMKVVTVMDEDGEEMEQFISPDESMLEDLIEVVQERFSDEGDKQDAGKRDAKRKRKKEAKKQVPFTFTETTTSSMTYFCRDCRHCSFTGGFLPGTPPWVCTARVFGTAIPAQLACNRFEKK